eukprot:3937751-Amphidinium_carterae.1
MSARFGASAVWVGFERVGLNPGEVHAEQLVRRKYASTTDGSPCTWEPNLGDMTYLILARASV